MLDGELSYHQGDFDGAFDHLRDAVDRNDNLAYTEPWGWRHPPRHALAALLSEQRHTGEAEAMYRADPGLDDTLQRCARHPDNIPALQGFVECLRRKGDAAEPAIYEPELTHAQSKTDVPIASSCLCRMKTPTASEGPPP